MVLGPIHFYVTYTSIDVKFCVQLCNCSVRFQCSNHLFGKIGRNITLYQYIFSRKTSWCSIIFLNPFSMFQSFIWNNIIPNYWVVTGLKTTGPTSICTKSISTFKSEPHSELFTSKTCPQVQHTCCYWYHWPLVAHARKCGCGRIHGSQLQNRHKCPNSWHIFYATGSSGSYGIRTKLM